MTVPLWLEKCKVTSFLPPHFLRTSLLSFVFFSTIVFVCFFLAPSGCFHEYLLFLIVWLLCASEWISLGFYYLGFIKLCESMCFKTLEESSVIVKHSLDLPSFLPFSGTPVTGIVELLLLSQRPLRLKKMFSLFAVNNFNCSIFQLTGSFLCHLHCAVKTICLVTSFMFSSSEIKHLVLHIFFPYWDFLIFYFKCVFNCLLKHSCGGCFIGFNR